MLRDFIISCVYFSNDILFVFMIALATMDNNVEILRVIGISERLVLPRGLEMSNIAPC